MTRAQPGLLAGGGRCPAPDPVCAAQPDLFFGPTPAIRVPVLLVVGDHDGLMCGGTGTDCSSAASVTASEQGHWTGTPCLHVDVIADAGHDLNLHRNAPSFYEVVRNWLGSFERHPGRCPG